VFATYLVSTKDKKSIIQVKRSWIGDKFKVLMTQLINTSYLDLNHLLDMNYLRSS